jgi:pimeloyl-ACP methyl ester carboxylesterase
VERQGHAVTADDGVALAGELVAPPGEKPAPAALILNGSGPLDRDSNMPEQALDIANTLATALAARGVASLRLDKRGVGASGGDYASMSFERETADAAAALASLREVPGVDPERLTLIGHSVGATLAMRLAAGDDRLAGVVLLSATAMRGEDVMRWQSERIASSLRWFERWRAARFLQEQERVRAFLLATEGDVASLDGVDVPARWFREFMAYDPEPDLRAIRCPVLAVTGRQDLQVDPDDVERIGALVAGPFDGDTPAHLTHVLRTRSGRAGLDTYPAQLRKPMDPALAERIATWVAAR